MFNCTILQLSHNYFVLFRLSLKNRLFKYNEKLGSMSLIDYSKKLTVLRLQYFSYVESETAATISGGSFKN